METIQAQITLDNARAIQELQKLNQTITGSFQSLSKALGDSLSKVRGDESGKKIGNEFVTAIKNSLAGLKIDKLNGVAIDPNNLKKIRDDITNAITGGKITNQQAATMLSALNSVGKETGKKIANDISSEGKKAGVSFGDLFKSSLLASLASSGIQTAISGLFSSIQGGFKLGADFEQQLSSIKALTGATADEMKKIEGVALKAGKETAFSALEAAKGLEELLKAGLNASQAQEGLKGALDLAAAGGIEVADAAEIASTALNAFRNDNLSVAQASDILAGAANGSATSVGELKFGLSQVSAVASGVGMSFKDTNTALALFAQNGLKGSDAGTSLKTMLLNLQPSTDAQASLFSELGLQTLETEKAFKKLSENGFTPLSKSSEDVHNAIIRYTQSISKSKIGTKEFGKDIENVKKELGLYQNQFFTTEGKVKSLAEISGVLKNALKNQTDQQRLASLETLFGTDAIRAANILYKEGADGVNKMTTEMLKFTAADVAKEKLNNFAGTLENLKGTIETALIQTFTSIIPKITPLLDQLNVAINTINFEQLGQTIGTALVGAINLLSGTISFVSNNFTILSSILAGITAGGVALGVVSAFTTISGAISAAGGVAAIFGATMAVIFAPITLIIAGIGLAVGLFALAWQTNFGNIQGVTQNVLSTISSVWSASWSAISSFFTATWATISGAFNSTISTISSLWASFTNTLSTVWTAIWETIKAFTAAVFLSLVAYITGDTLKINTIMAAFGERFKAIWGETLEAVKTTLSNAGVALLAKFEEIKNGAGNAIKEAVDNINNTWKAGWDLVGSINVADIAKNVINGFVNGIKNGVGNVMNAMRDLANSAVNAAKENLQIKSPSRVMVEIGSFVSEGMGVGILNGASKVANSVKNITDLITQTAQNKLKNLNLGQLGSASFGVSQVGIMNDGTAPAPTTLPTPINQPPQNPNIPEPQATTPQNQPPSDPATLTKPIEDTANKTSEGLDGLIEKIKTGISGAISEGAKAITEEITKMDEGVVAIFNLVNENWITIAQAIGQNVINGIISGLQKGERSIYSAIAALETNALKAVNIEVKSREENGDAGRGAALGVGSVMNPNVELIRGFKSFSAGDFQKPNQDNSRNINIQSISVSNQQDRDIFEGQLNGLWAV